MTVMPLKWVLWRDNNVQRFQLENPDREKSGVGQRQWVRKVYSSSFIAEVL